MIKFENRFSVFNLFSSLKLENVNFISSIPIFYGFDQLNQCYASSNEELYYSDSNHLTLTGANLITEKINIFLVDEQK